MQTNCYADTWPQLNRCYWIHVDSNKFHFLSIQLQQKYQHKKSFCRDISARVKSDAHGRYILVYTSTWPSAWSLRHWCVTRHRDSTIGACRRTICLCLHESLVSPAQCVRSGSISSFFLWGSLDCQQDECISPCGITVASMKGLDLSSGNSELR